MAPHSWCRESIRRFGALHCLRCEIPGKQLQRRRWRLVVRHRMEILCEIDCLLGTVSSCAAIHGAKGTRILTFTAVMAIVFEALSLWTCGHDTHLPFHRSKPAQLPTRYENHKNRGVPEGDPQ